MHGSYNVGGDDDDDGGGDRDDDISSDDSILFAGYRFCPSHYLLMRSLP